MELPAAQRPAGPRFRFFRSFSALVLREMTTSYGRSPGGYLWAILEPVAGIALMTVVFSFILRNPPLGTNFIYFFASGLLPFGLYVATQNATATSIRYSLGLLEYPAVSFIDAVFARFALNAMTQILVMFLILTGTIWFFDLAPVIRWPWIFLSLAMALSLAMGVGLMNCYLISNYPLWERAWAILNRPLFILSCIMFTPDMLGWQVREWLLWNPLVHVVGAMRKGLFVTYEAKYIDLTYVFGLSLVLAVLGLLFLRRYHKDIVLK